MMLPALRYLPLVALSLLLAGCQTRAPLQPYQAPVDAGVAAFQELDGALAAGRLDEARTRLTTLRANRPGDTRVEQYQRQLVEAYLLQGQQALRDGNLNQATSALGHARELLPQAPALTAGLDQAIARGRAQQLEQDQAAQAAAAQAEASAREAAEQRARAQQLRQEADRQRLASPPPTETQQPAAPRARLIDADALSSTVPLPMLESDDSDALRSLLDAAAHDVVNFDCSVRIDVREAKDFPWVAALLSARVKKVNPAYTLRLSRNLMPDQAPQLVLRPRR